ncbi:MAG TPA: hypothetical protein VE056_11670 [Pyrinomonadaceae bacterium]|nr:hypothetical protein [Pyrinomonadaceae bacterium]
MYSSTVVSTTLLRNSIQLALLLGIFSVAILATEHVTRKTKSRISDARSAPQNGNSHTLRHFVPYTYASSGLAFQQDDVWALIKTEDGTLFVWNLHELHFTLAVKGKEIKQVNVPDRIFLAVDGKTLQIQAAQISNFAPNAREKKLDNKAVLAAHRDWESNYIGELLKNKLTLKSFSVNMSALGAASLWEFDMPEGMNSEAKTQVYVTVVSGDYVLMLNCEATTTTPEVEVRKFLLDTIATLKTSSESIDVQKLSESIRAGRKP